MDTAVPDSQPTIADESRPARPFDVVVLLTLAGVVGWSGSGPSVQTRLW